MIVARLICVIGLIGDCFVHSTLPYSLKCGYLWAPLSYKCNGHTPTLQPLYFVHSYKVAYVFSLRVILSLSHPIMGYVAPLGGGPTNGFRASACAMALSLPGQRFLLFMQGFVCEWQCWDMPLMCYVENRVTEDRSVVAIG